MPGLGARAGLHGHVPRVQGGVALRADDQGVERVAAHRMPMQQGPAFLAGHVYITPVHDGHDHGMQVQPLGREAVLVPYRRLLVGHLLEHACLDQPGQPVRQHGA